MNYSTDDEDEDQFLIDASSATVDVLTAASQAYVQIVRGILGRPPLRPIIHSPFSTARILLQTVGGHPMACHNAIGMSASCLERITDDIDQLHRIKPTDNVSLQAKVAMTLWMLRKAASNRLTQQYWQISQASISK